MRPKHSLASGVVSIVIRQDGPHPAKDPLPVLRNHRGPDMAPAREEPQGTARSGHLVQAFAMVGRDDPVTAIVDQEQRQGGEIGDVMLGAEGVVDGPRPGILEGPGEPEVGQLLPGYAPKAGEGAVQDGAGDCRAGICQRILRGNDGR